MTPSASLTIGWNEIDKRLFTDSLGRVFLWTDLKNKKIYMCGHGAHIYRDGYTTVPAGTTVNFYQVYGQALMNTDVMKFLKGEQWQPERSFEAGKSCPNMTLFDDDDREIDATKEALNARMTTDPSPNDHYVFMCNGFRGLPRYAPVLKPGFPAHAFAGKQFLKLSDILLHLKGNTLEWTCCQDVGMERNQTLLNGEALTLGQLREKEQFNAHTAGSSALGNKMKLFSDTVRAGLKSALMVKVDIEKGYNPQAGTRILERHAEGTVASTLHGNPKRAPLYYLNRQRAGTSQRDRDDMAKYRDQIKAALQALDTDPQPGPPFERTWATDTLKRGLKTAQSSIDAFAALKST